MQPLNHLTSLLKASWQGAVLILLVLGAQWIFGRRLSPRWRYWLWLLVLIRLALPWTVPSQISLFNLLRFRSSFSTHTGGPGLEAGQSAVPAPIEQESSTLQSAAAPPPLAPNFSWLLALWAAGASALAIYLGVTHYRISRKVARLRPLVEPRVMNLLEDCKQQMRVRVPVTLVETAEVGSPALFGFVRPRLLLPAGLTRNFSLEELRYVFLHELGHIKRNDILIGWLMAALQILHWFNPLVWLGFHRMRVDRELACDALALSYAQEEENQPYGRTIIKLLEKFGSSAWAPSLAGTVENRNQMKERISMIAKFEKTNRGLALAVVLLAGLGVITMTDARPGGSPVAKDLAGSWILVGRPGEVGEAPAVGGRIKLITDRDWSLTQADPKTGEVMFHHGGTYALKGNEYAENIEYANENTKYLVGKTSKFTIKLEGDTLTLTGVGNPWNEVWKRAKSGSLAPQKLDSTPLQGKWRGTEKAAKDPGASSLVIRGSSLEFHGSADKEWYKASFSVYDTTPKQMVILITDCSVPEYVGRTGYAIYEIKEGALTITGNEPGTPAAPAGFDAPGARKLVFSKE